MRPKIFVISTVGTSILGNVEREYLDKIPEKYRSLVKGASRLSVDDPKQEEFLKRAYENDELFISIYNIVCSNPTKLSAELNALLNFIKNHYFRFAEAEMIEFNLYSTDTGTAWFCAKIIEKWLRQELSRHYVFKGQVLVNEPIKLRKFGWGYTFFPEALLDMIDKVAKVIVSKKRQGYKVYVNATAGFKVETTYLTIISLMLDVDSVFYIHEATHEVVELPMLPLDLREHFKKMLDELKEPLRKEILEETYGVSVEELRERGLVEVENGLVKTKIWIKKLIEITKELPK